MSSDRLLARGLCGPQSNQSDSGPLLAPVRFFRGLPPAVPSPTTEYTLPVCCDVLFFFFIVSAFRLIRRAISFAADTSLSLYALPLAWLLAPDPAENDDDLDTCSLVLFGPAPPASDHDLLRFGRSEDGLSGVLLFLRLLLLLNAPCLLFNLSRVDIFPFSLWLPPFPPFPLL